MSSIVLTEEQESALQGARSMTGLSLTIGGYAGTGKTILINEMLKSEQFKNWAVASFTGKAVDVLRSKGVKCAQTIHSLMYQVKVDKENYELEFKRMSDLEQTGVIIDEASMVSTDLYQDLRKFRIPIIWVGDMGQLEPIGDDPRLMSDPDFKLETIHRQALKSPITQLSMLIRQDAELSEWHTAANDTELSIRRQSKDVYAHLIEFAARAGTMTIVGYNRTRMDVNKKARELRGYSDVVCVGDKVICMANESSLEAFNGMTGVVTEVISNTGSVYRLRIHVEGTEKDYHYRCETGLMTDPDFNKSRWMIEAMERRNDDGGNDITLWDYGYAITCHKAQGSEADEVAVWDQQCDYWEPIRWRYTAVTRARKKLIYCT